MRGSKRFFKAAGYVFTYRREEVGTTMRLDMWREDAAMGERYWVTTARCTADRHAAYAAAMALVAWVRSLDVAPREESKAQAVAESLAITLDRMARSPRPTNRVVALPFPLTRRTAAA